MSNDNPDSTKPATEKAPLFASKKGEVILREHSFDGIQEYDQKLPNWWLFTLYAAIALFVVLWLLYYTFDKGQSDRAIVGVQVEALSKKKEAALQETLSNLNDKTLIDDWATNPTIVAQGEKVYMSICFTCHGVDLSATQAGTPLPGRPLNDGIWEYGKAPMAIFKMINDGTPPDGPGLNGMKMIPKGGLQLTPKQVAELTAFIISKNPKDFAGSTFDASGKLIQ